jgi:hypothetical protein
MATQLLDSNNLNRPISDQHVQRIAGQIREGKWRFNGDTIKISEDESVLDGQHRLWAVMESKTAVETILVRGLKREAFTTIDTIRRPRSGGDTIALSGIVLHRNQIAMALSWLLRWQRGVIHEYKAPQHRIENSDIEAAFTAHPGMARALEVASKVRAIANPAVIGFAYYAMANQNTEVAEKFIYVMRDPAGVGVNYPFFRLRSYFVTDRTHRKDPVMSIALIFKAANAVCEGREMQVLAWRSQGEKPEAFPILKLNKD